MKEGSGRVGERDVTAEEGTREVDMKTAPGGTDNKPLIGHKEQWVWQLKAPRQDMKTLGWSIPDVLDPRESIRWWFKCTM